MVSSDSVTVSMRQTPTHVQLLVSDDGRGVFDKIQEAFDITDPAVAALELSKTPLTAPAAPARADPYRERCAVS